MNGLLARNLVEQYCENNNVNGRLEDVFVTGEEVVAITLYCGNSSNALLIDVLVWDKDNTTPKTTTLDTNTSHENIRSISIQDYQNGELVMLMNMGAYCGYRKEKVSFDIS